VLTIRAMTSGEGYAQRHLQQRDYYDQNRTVEGDRHGRDAERLGPKKEVTSEDFEAVRQRDSRYMPQERGPIAIQRYRS